MACQAPITWNPALSPQSDKVSPRQSTSGQLGKRKRDQNYVGEPDPKRICPFEPDCSETESGEDENTDLAEPFNPDTLYERAAKELLHPIEDYVRKFFRYCLKEAHRKSMSRENPLPTSQALCYLKVDYDIREFQKRWMTATREFSPLLMQLCTSIELVEGPRERFYKRQL